MVDEYGRPTANISFMSSVQIPLWSMNTQGQQYHAGQLRQFRFLYGRWIRGSTVKVLGNFEGSDSSMVDEYQVDFDRF